MFYNIWYLIIQMNTNTKTSKIHPKSPTFSSCSTPHNNFAPLSCLDSPNPHNQHNSNQLLGFKNKLSMLRIASNRLSNQHQSLAQIHTNEFKNNVVGRFKQFMANVDGLGTKITALRQNLKENAVKLQQNLNIEKNSHDLAINNLWQSLNKVREQSNSTNKQCQIYGQIAHSSYNPTQQVDKINNYAQHIIQQTISNYEQTRKSKIRGQMSLLLEQQQMSQYWHDVQSDLGLLLCQMFYLKSKHESNYKEFPSIDNNLELDDIEAQFQHYISQTQERITYKSQKLKDKMHHLKSCLFKNKNTKYRHSPTNCTHGHQQQSPTDKKSMKPQNSSCLLEKYSSELKTIDTIHKQLEQENDGLIFGSYLLIQKYKEIRKSLGREASVEYQSKQQDLLKKSQRINKLVEDSQQRLGELQSIKSMVGKL